MRRRLYTYGLLIGLFGLVRAGGASTDLTEKYAFDDNAVALLQLNKGLELEPLRILSSADCVRVLAMHDSDVSSLKEELRAYGLLERTDIRRAQPDPDGAEAGCFRAHVNAWQEGYEKGCSNMLVLEEDAAIFNVTAYAGASRADKFINSGISYDVLFLGWSAPTMTETNFSLHQLPDADCAFEIIARKQTHAYIISSEAMTMWRHWQYSTSHPSIDNYMNEMQRQRRQFTVRPGISYQSCHKTSIPWKDAMSVKSAHPELTDEELEKLQDWQEHMEEDMCHPEVAFGHQAEMYARFGYADTCV
eukprot:TRINITY_DN7452_c0_g2_i1.p1 TRINITY_DN7452_c0_g2~~TRINITY_DN7452_c0_g2_i1.p1  ORF type:complete len:304 (-),score=39.71 TRINITY_DN7452_c0_g2_i1:103-1014(-)